MPSKSETGGARRHQNHGIRKVCGCLRARWPKCEHPWHFNYKPKGGPAYRFSLDGQIGKRIEGKTEALAAADDIRSAIRSGTFRRRTDPAPVEAAPATPDAITLRAFIGVYTERRAKPVSTNDRVCLGRFAAFTPEGGRPLGEMPIGCLTEDTVEAFFATLRREGRAASTRNKYVQAITALFRWAAKKGYLARNPVVDSDTIRRQQHAKRDRRLVADVVNAKTGQNEREGEERRLLAVAGPSLQRLIIGSLEAGARLSELLRLTWGDVDFARKELTIRAETAKARKARVLPVSSRLAGVLEMARTELTMFLFNREPQTEAEQAQLAACFVFGDSAGRRVKCVRKAWDTAVLKAHGYRPEWVGANTLSGASRAALRAINLKFHDLRHEAGSRFLEAGWPLHHVQELLGHASIEQTSTYLNITRSGLHESMRRFDAAVSRCNPVANAVVVERAPLRNEDGAQVPQHQVN